MHGCLFVLFRDFNSVAPVRPNFMSLLFFLCLFTDLHFMHSLQ